MAELSEPAPTWKEWLHRNRASPRLAFLLRTGVTVLGALLSLFWARQLVRSLGNEVYGVFLAFLAIVQLGGLSELGLAGGVGINVMNYLSKGDDEACRRFLATARGVVLLVSAAMFVAGLAFVPWAPRLLGFQESPGTGSIPALFAFGVAGVALSVVCSYWQNLNYVAGNVVWPILPGFVFAQLGSAAQWVLALHGAPLWSQFAAGLVTTLVSVWLLWFMLRQWRPLLAELVPVRFDLSTAVSLSTTSLWVFIATVGNLIYLTCDRILINGAFGPGLLPAYRFNYRLCEMFSMLLAGATYVALPAIAGRLLHLDPTVRAQGEAGFDRLRKLQTFACCGIGLGYLGVNDLFMTVWLGAGYRVSLLLQCCFVLNFVVSVSGEGCIQLPGRMDAAGARMGGAMTAVCGFINLALSLLATRYQSLVGVAAATVVAQSVFSWAMTIHTAGRLQRRPWRLIFESWAMPVLIVAAGSALCAALRPLGVANGFVFAGGCAILLVILAACIGLTLPILQDELGKLVPLFARSTKIGRNRDPQSGG